MATFINSARFRLILLVLIAVIPVLGLTLYTGFQVRQQASEKARVEAVRLIKISADSYNDIITSGQQLLTGLAQLPQVIQHNQAECNLLFLAMLKEFSEYTNLAAADSQGNIFCSGTQLSTPVNISDRGYFQQVMKTRQFAVSDYVINRETQKSSIIMAHPSFDAQGKLQAVVTASLDLTLLNDTVATAQLPQQSVFFITDSKGTILARSPDPQQWVGKAVPESTIIQYILQQKVEGTIEMAGMDSIKRLYAFQPVQIESNNPMYMAVGFPTQNVYIEANRLLYTNLVYLGVVAVIALSAAWLLGDVLILRQIKPLFSSAERWAAGDLSARTEMRKGPVEFVRLASAFDSMAEAIQQREGQIREAEREAAENVTRMKIQQALISQRENERLKIARDLHDGPVQAITGVTYALYEMQQTPQPLEVADKLEEIRTTLKDQISELRNYASELRPPALSNLGLGRAIHAHIETFQSKHPEYRIQFEEALDGKILPEETVVALFRIYQELLNNITKHAQASKICVHLKPTAEGVTLEVQDNGIGFVVAKDWLELARQGHLGLVGIQERAEAIGGKALISSAAGAGTLVRIVVPLQQAQGEAYPTG